MAIDRRQFLAAAAAVGTTAPAWAAPAPKPPLVSALGIDAAHLGLRAGSPDDQTTALQRAINQAAAAQVPLALGPGTYRAADIALPAGAHIVAPRGTARIIALRSRPIFTAANADRVTLAGLVLDGGRAPLEGAGLLTMKNGRQVKIVDCEIVNSGGHGILLEGVAGEISSSTVRDAADVAILSHDARGLTIARNLVREAGNNGIQILRNTVGEDGTMVLDNRIEDVRNRAGGSGQYGNGVNAHRAANVIVRGNRIQGCAFSAVRGNSASDIQIVGNSCSDIGDVAFYSEFSFEGAVIANNTVTRASTGISVANFNEGGRLAVVSGNILRDLAPRGPGLTPGEDWSFGIYVEADTAVTGNVIEKATVAGIIAGWGKFLRDVTITGNVVRAAPIGIGVSVVPGAGSAVIANNSISGARLAAVAGMDHLKPVTGDLTAEGATRYSHLTINGNRVN